MIRKKPKGKAKAESMDVKKVKAKKAILMKASLVVLLLVLDIFVTPLFASHRIFALKRSV